MRHRLVVAVVALGRTVAMCVLVASRQLNAPLVRLLQQRNTRRAHLFPVALV